MVDFTKGLFFDDGEDPYMVSPFSEQQVLARVAQQQQPFSPITPMQAQQAVAPMAAPPGLERAMPPSGRVPTIPGAPQQQPAGASAGLGAFFNSPGLAMAGQAMNNMFAMRRGHAPQVNPIQAYQQSVANQAAQANRAKEMEMRAAQEARAAEKHRADMDPAYDYNKLVEQGLIDPAKTSYEAFQRLGLSSQLSAPQKNFSTWLELNPQRDDESDEEYQARAGAAFDNIVRAPITWGTGPGTVGVSGAVSPGGNQELGNTQATIAREADLAGAKEGATGGAKYDQGQVDEATARVWANQEAYNMAQRMRDVSLEFKDRLDTGEINTGLFEGFMLNTFGVGSEGLAEMSAEQVMQTLQNLGITNLAPVTVQELQYVARLWADISKQEQPNQGTLTAAVNRSERLMERLELDTRNQLTRVKEYGGDDRRQSIIDSNPWVSGLVTGGKPEVWVRNEQGQLVKQ